MTTKDRINNRYFEWMFDLVCSGRYDGPVTYRKLLSYLHNTEFTYIIPMDSNRAENGIDMRWRFVLSEDCKSRYEYLDGPCSVFEMMIALAMKIEEIMYDTAVGDRTGQWFWGMISDLGLKTMIDDNFDKDYVEEVVMRFLNREYEPNGRGSLFVIKDCTQDLRKVEIFQQLCWYLDEYFPA